MKAVSFSNDVIIQQIIKSIVELVNPDKIILFGSHATGKATKDSDYDICVLKKNANRKALTHKLYSIGLNANAPVDMIVNTPSRFEKLKEYYSYVYYDIAKDGIVIYEKTK